MQGLYLKIERFFEEGGQGLRLLQPFTEGEPAAEANISANLP